MAKKTDKVQELEEKVNQLDAQLKRAVADYHNLEKRVAEGRSELTKWGTAEMIKRLLPVIDHLEQALGSVSAEEKGSGWVRGVELAVKEFQQVLASEGLEQIATDGQFDPNLHEAVDTREGDDNKIIEVVRNGYTLNDRVLRPSAVVVGRSNVIANEVKQSSSEEDLTQIASDSLSPRNDGEEEKGEMSS